MKLDWNRIVTPGAWVQNGKVNWKYDEWLNKKIDEHGISRNKHIGMGYTSNIGKFVIWTSNYPYGYGTPHKNWIKTDVLPSVTTRKRIKRILEDKEWGDE